jgi:hypothetical protein
VNERRAARRRSPTTSKNGEQIMRGTILLLAAAALLSGTSAGLAQGYAYDPYDPGYAYEDAAPLGVGPGYGYGFGYGPHWYGHPYSERQPAPGQGVESAR